MKKKLACKDGKASCTFPVGYAFRPTGLAVRQDPRMVLPEGLCHVAEHSALVLVFVGRDTSSRQPGSRHTDGGFRLQAPFLRPRSWYGVSSAANAAVTETRSISVVEKTTVERDWSAYISWTKEEERPSPFSEGLGL